MFKRTKNFVERHADALLYAGGLETAALGLGAASFGLHEAGRAGQHLNAAIDGLKNLVAYLGTEAQRAQVAELAQSQPHDPSLLMGMGTLGMIASLGLAAYGIKVYRDIDRLAARRGV